MSIAVIGLDFDPFLHLGDRVVRWETLALAGSILVVILLAALRAGRTAAADFRGGVAGRAPSAGAAPHAGDRDAGGSPSSEPWHLRRDDLLFIILGAVPGAVIGGRLGYVLIHLDYYSVHQSAVTDPAQGGLELSVALVLGTTTGAYVARLLEAPVGRWLAVATVPLLLGLALGKLSMALGGSGQGAPAGVDWATRYGGAGPWSSLDAATPAHPSQIYEALVTLGVLLVVLVLGRARPFRRPNGRLFAVGVALWALGRFAVAFTWRDPEVAGSLRADQLIALGIAAGSILLLLVSVATRARSTRQAVRAEADLRWPDPDSPRIF